MRSKRFFQTCRQARSVWTAAMVMLAAVFVVAAPLSAADGPNMLKRFPHIHGDTVVFVSGEDIWKAPVSGGEAVRLTVHDGEERHPRISPCGKWVAFTGEYDGNADVYVMNLYGGEITRVTWHPAYDQVLGWHKGSGRILFVSGRYSYSRYQRLYLIKPDGTGLEELPMPEAGAGSFSPDEIRIAYNKTRREDRTWKRYRGGRAQDVYIFNLQTLQEKNISAFEGTDRSPMWIGDNVYYVSDRDGVLNIFRYNTQDGTTEQVTRHREFDVRRASAGGKRIVYEVGGDIWLLDTERNENRKLAITTRADAPETRPVYRNVKDRITHFGLSPDGESALVTARGEVFALRAKDGVTRNISRNCGARDKDAVWSPDGKHLAYFSDASGEYEVVLADAQGYSQPRTLTRHKDGYRHTLRWSPDSKHIAFADSTLRCHILDVNTRKIITVDKAEYEHVDVSLDVKPIYDFSWSPDSRYLAYSKMNSDLVYQLHLYDTQSGKSTCVSNGRYNDFNPVFSEDGKRLFFISNRRFRPTYCDFQWEMVYKDVAGIYSLSLKKGLTALFPAKGVSAEPLVPVPGKNQKPGCEVEFTGITERVEAFPLPAGNYRNLHTAKGHLFFLNADKGDFNRFEFRGTGPMDLSAFSFKTGKSELVAQGIGGYSLSHDGGQVIFRKGPGLFVAPSSARKSAGKPLDLSGLRLRMDPKKEWRQIFHEAWRLERDFYYEPNMHGIDWPAMRDKYARLLDRATCRQDIQFIIGELIGELNTSHTYVFGGDRMRTPPRVSVGLLGVDWKADEQNGRWRIARVLTVPEWTITAVPPLSTPGLNVEDGTYVLAVNGEEVTTKRNIHSYFVDMAGKPVDLTINAKPETQGARTITVVPVRNTGFMRYVDWVERNRRTVEKMSGGKLGYLHLPDTYNGSAMVFPKYFYTQTRKQGIVVDGRFNGGGLDPGVFLRRLANPPHSYWTRRQSHDQTSPFFAPRAHMALLTNRQAGSGGDMLPRQFRLMKMGPIIGTRTWGGLVGVSQFLALIDGGGLTAPDYRIYDAEGKWVVENVGVKPDIEVDIEAAAMREGRDNQLMTAIEYLMKKIAAEPLSWPEHEAYPVDRTRK